MLPIGATINMDGTSLYQAVAAVFIAQAFGMELSFGTQLGIIATATLASIGSAAVPGAGMVMLVGVLGYAGIPEAARDRTKHYSESRGPPHAARDSKRASRRDQEEGVRGHAGPPPPLLRTWCENPPQGWRNDGNGTSAYPGTAQIF